MAEKFPEYLVPLKELYESHANPDYVINFVNNHSLSGLSEREALKWMKNKGIL